MPSVAIVGASGDPERYSHQAILRYLAQGWTVWPIHPKGGTIAGLPVLTRIEDLPGRPDIVCLYVNPQIGLGMLEAIAAANPMLLWLNPGADGPAIAVPARAKGLRVVEACTLVVQAQGDPLKIALERLHPPGH